MSLNEAAFLKIVSEVSPGTYSESYKERMFRTDKYWIIPSPSTGEMLFTVHWIKYHNQQKVLATGPGSTKTLDEIKKILTQEEWLNFQRHVFDKLI